MAATLKPCVACCGRPGRLDKLLYVALPGPEARAAILQALTKRTPLAPDVDLHTLGCSPHMQGFSGADLAALVREAAVTSLKVSHAQCSVESLILVHTATANVSSFRHEVVPIRKSKQCSDEAIEACAFAGGSKAGGGMHC